MESMLIWMFTKSIKGYESNGYKDEEYYHEEDAEHQDDAHFGRNPHYSERYESMEGTSDYRDEYRQQYPGLVARDMAFLAVSTFPRRVTLRFW